MESHFEFLAHCKIISYDVDKFNQIMKEDNITPKEIAKSFSLIKNRQMIFKANQGEGKSGSFFFNSNDKRFLIKTLQGSEKETLLGMMNDLIKHYQKYPSSLIARIYGIFTLKSEYFDPIEVMIMKNTAFASEGNSKMTFDIKGSTMNRFVNVPDQ